jgi:signal peptidase II
MKHLSAADANTIPLYAKVMFVLCAAGIFAADQVSKAAVVSLMRANESIPLVRGFFHLTFIYNTGASFGMMQGNNSVFIITNASIILMIIVAVFFLKGITPLGRALLGLIAGGAAGNVADRARYGAVVDFLDFRGIWNYIFNVADAAVVCSAILFALVIIFDIGAPGKLKSKPRH